MIVVDSNSTTSVKSIRTLFERVQKHSVMLSPSKARLGATDAGFPGHFILPTIFLSNPKKLPTLTKLPMPQDLK